MRTEYNRKSFTFMHKYLNYTKTLKMFMYFPDLLLYHRFKHKHNITKHNTPIFYVVHYQEGSYIHWNFVYMIFSKGGNTKFHCAPLVVSLSLTQSLCTPSSQSLLSLSKWSMHSPIRYAKNNKFMQRLLALSKDKDIFPFTIYSLFIVWLKSLRLHSCGPKALHPQNPLQNGPKPFTEWG